jgi:hypothetical protein
MKTYAAPAVNNRKYVPVDKIEIFEINKFNSAVPQQKLDLS